MEKQTDGKTNRWKNKQMVKQTDGKTDRQIDRQAANTQMNGQTRI
jgi:hypothetical protein